MLSFLAVTTICSLSHSLEVMFNLQYGVVLHAHVQVFVLGFPSSSCYQYELGKPSTTAPFCSNPLILSSLNQHFDVTNEPPLVIPKSHWNPCCTTRTSALSNAAIAQSGEPLGPNISLEFEVCIFYSSMNCDHRRQPIVARFHQHLLFSHAPLFPLGPSTSNPTMME